MPRKLRFFLPGVPAHVIQRGNNRQAIFFDDNDYRTYLNLIRDGLDRFGCALHAYVLMTNHVHLLLTPPEPGSVSALMQWVGRYYVPYTLRRVARPRALFGADLDQKGVDEVRACLQTETPLGNDRFREQIEQALDRKVGFTRRGRPRLPVSEDGAAEGQLGIAGL